MIPELGQFALSLALGLALVQAVLGLAGAARADAVWMAAARPAAQGQLVFVAIAFGCLTYAFVTNDFSVLYVANNSNSKLPLQYQVAGVWGGHEGSLLLWTLMLAVWTTAVSVFSRRLPEDMVARVLGVMGLVTIGFIAFMLFTSNPFDRLIPAAADGRTSTRATRATSRASMPRDITRLTTSSRTSGSAIQATTTHSSRG